MTDFVDVVIETLEKLAKENGYTLKYNEPNIGMSDSLISHYEFPVIVFERDYTTQPPKFSGDDWA